MSISNLKSKLSSLVQDNSSNDLVPSKSSLKSTPSILSKDIKIQGDLVSSGLIEIEGAIIGNIKGNAVILREDAKVEGEIIAESVSIKGSFNGNIKAKNINISGKAKISGVIEYVSLAVEDGACIEGQFKKLNLKS